MNAQNAQLCFEENIRLFANPMAQPEKYNLYNGLANMAIAMQALQHQVTALSDEVARLRQQLKN